MSLINVGLLLLAIAFILVALNSMLRGLFLRSKMQNAYYGVGRQAEQRNMLINMAWGGLWMALGLILLVGFGISQSVANEVEPVVTATPVSLPSPTALATVVQAIATSTPLPTPVQLTTSVPTASPTTPVDIPTQEPTPSPTVTSTPKPPSVIVNSPNGLYLRDVAGGFAEVELIPDGAELVLLDGRATARDFEWQKVRTPIGNEGWVAIDFLIFPEQ